MASQLQAGTDAAATSASHPLASCGGSDDGNEAVDGISTAGDVGTGTFVCGEDDHENPRKRPFEAVDSEDEEDSEDEDDDDVSEDGEILDDSDSEEEDLDSKDSIVGTDGIATSRRPRKRGGHRGGKRGGKRASKRGKRAPRNRRSIAKKAGNENHSDGKKARRRGRKRQKLEDGTRDLTNDHGARDTNGVTDLHARFPGEGTAATVVSPQTGGDLHTVLRKALANPLQMDPVNALKAAQQWMQILQPLAAANRPCSINEVASPVKGMNDKDKIQLLVGLRSAGFVGNDVIDEFFNSDLVADRDNNKDITKGRWIKFKDYASVHDELAARKSQSGDGLMINPTSHGRVAANIRRAWVEDVDDNDFYIKVAYTHERQGPGHLPPSVQKDRILLQDIASYHGGWPLPEDRLFTHNFHVEEGACLSLERRKLSRDSPMKAIGGRMLDESKYLLLDLTAKREMKHEQSGRYALSITYENVMRQRRKRAESASGEPTNKTGIRRAMEDSNAYWAEQAPALNAPVFPPAADYSAGVRHDLPGDSYPASDGPAPQRSCVPELDREYGRPQPTFQFQGHGSATTRPHQSTGYRRDQENGLSMPQMRGQHNIPDQHRGAGYPPQQASFYQRNEPPAEPAAMRDCERSSHQYQSPAAYRDPRSNAQRNAVRENYTPLDRDPNPNNPAYPTVANTPGRTNRSGTSTVARNLGAFTHGSSTRSTRRNNHQTPIGPRSRYGNGMFDWRG